MSSRPAVNKAGRSATSGGRGLTLPRSGLLVHAKRFDPTVLAIADKMGDSRRTIQDLQYCQCDGTGYFAGTLTGSETVTSKQGTATVTFASGRMNVGAGTLWSVVLSNGSRYEFATRTGATSALLMDVSGNGRHLVATSFADVSALCATSKTQGSDHANLNGWSAGGLGPELVVNGGFDNGTTGWNPFNGTISVIGGKLRVTSSGTNWPYGNSSITTVPGVLYQVSASGYAGSINTFQLVVKAETAGSDLYLSISSGNANVSGTFIATHSYSSVRAYARLPPAAGAYYDWDNISVKLSVPSTGIVPALSSNPALDALGNAVQYPGRARYDVKPVDAPASTWASGTSVAITGITGATILSKEGTAVVTIGTNVINYSSAGTLYNLKLTLTNGRVLTIPFLEGAGTTVLGYDDQGTVYTGTVTTSDLTAFWAGKQSTFFPGLQYGYSDRENRIPNSEAVGASVGVAPTGWSPHNSVNNGITRTVVALDGGGFGYRFAGTASANSSFSTYIEPGTIAGVSGDTFCGKLLITIESGRVATGGLLTIRLAEVNSSLGYIASTDVAFSPGVNEVSRTFSGGLAAYCRLYLVLYTPSGQSIDVTIRISHPQLTKTATQQEYCPTYGTAVVGHQPANPATPGLDCRGNALTNPPLIINRSASYQLQGPEVMDALWDWRENRVPNSEAVGGAVGALPTGWAKTEENGITTTVVGAGSGYIDVTIAGTATATALPTIRASLNNTVAALPGETWTASSIITLLSGTFPSTKDLYLSERGSGGASLATQSIAAITSGEITSVSRTLTKASCLYVVGIILFSIPNGSSVDFTIRISQPQLTKTATQLPYTPTSGTAIVPLTYPESSWFNSDGTAKTLTYDQVVAAVDGVNTFYNDRRGLAIYEQVSVPITADEQRYRMKARKYYDLGSTILEDGTVLDDNDLLW